MLPCVSSTGLSPSLAGFPKTVPLPSGSLMQSEPRGARTPVWAPPVSLAATSGIDVSFFSSGYLDVSVHRVPFRTLWIGVRMTEVLSAGFPHSEICGSMDICSSPQLIAAYRVFHRLLVPRHPPCALCRFTFAFRHLWPRAPIWFFVCIALHTFTSQLALRLAAPLSYKDHGLSAYQISLLSRASRMSCLDIVSYAVFKVQNTLRRGPRWWEDALMSCECHRRRRL